VVVGLALWFLKGRGKGTPAAPAQRTPGKSAAEKPAPMVACAHCGVHLPRLEASVDAEGRAYCGEAHRVAGPR
jgi:uncharacterized protein